MTLRAGRVLLLAAAIGAVFAAPASAHPLGNFSVNRYSRIELGPERVTLRYVLDLAEIPTLQELSAAGLAPDASADDVARTMLPSRAAAIADRARLLIAGRPVEWAVRDSSLSLPDGQAGLRTLRVALTLVAPAGARAGDVVEYRDANEPGRTGWHEIVLRGVDGLGLTASSVPADDRSDELRGYPADPTVASPDLDRATARVGTAGASAAAAPVIAETASRLGIDAGADRLTGFLRSGPGADLSALLAALGVAAILGALHALGPGHGKSIVGAYLVGSRGTPLHAVLLGATVTVTHTAGVYALGLLTLVAAQYVLPERVYPVLGLASGLVVVGIGASLARSRLGALRHGHDHPHAHAHEHGHAPHGVSLRSLLALGVSGGLLPCPTALVVLLAAISFHNVALGMALVAAFSAGLAAVLTGIGLAMVGAGRALARSSSARRVASWPMLRVVPVLSAVAIAVAGVVIALDAARAFA